MSLRGRSCVASVVLLGLLVAVAGCERFQGGSTTTPPGAIAGVPSDASGEVPLGQIAGTPQGAVGALSTPNPYAGNPQAVQQGKELFIRMNCAGCHAYSGKGNMGPNLTDAYWRYGGLPIQIYKTLVDGRPNGMPAWGAALPPDDIWKLVAYIQSLGGTVSVSDYHLARQGDHSNTQIAPEAQAETELAPNPVRISPNLPPMMKTDLPATPSQTPSLSIQKSGQKKP